MERVLGIGVVFFKPRDAGGPSRWYAEHLGVGALLDSYDEPVWRPEAGPLVFAPFGEEHWGSPHLGPTRWGISSGCATSTPWSSSSDARASRSRSTREPYPNGRFAQLHDPEGNAVQLWQELP